MTTYDPYLDSPATLRGRPATRRQVIQDREDAAHCVRLIWRGVGVLALALAWAVWCLA